MHTHLVYFVLLDPASAMSLNEKALRVTMSVQTMPKVLKCVSEDLGGAARLWLHAQSSGAV